MSITLIDKPAHLPPKDLLLPLYTGIQAGFPSPAGDYTECRIDLNDHLVDNPTATFYARVEGDSMIGVGIYPGSVLVVDKSLTARNGDIVVAVVDQDFTVKRLEKKFNKMRLLPENAKYKPIEIREGMQVEIWGVVTYVILNAKKL
jgi:DNA polymerase V